MQGVPPANKQGVGKRLQSGAGAAGGRSGMSAADKQAAFSDDKWDRALDLLVRRTCYGALGGAAVAFLILRELGARCCTTCNSSRLCALLPSPAMTFLPRRCGREAQQQPCCIPNCLLRLTLSTYLHPLLPCRSAHRASYSAWSWSRLWAWQRIPSKPGPFP